MTAVVVVLAVLVVVLLVLGVIEYRQRSRLGARLEGLTRGADGSSLEDILSAHLDKVYEVAREVDLLSARTARLEAETPRSLQRVGLVRFNPFEDTGGNQSFVIALLDGNGDGIILSSLHARSGTRIYGKAVNRGKPETTLSDEESQALREALVPRSALATAGRQ
ncbi:MAG TPA: DUF4446 family protein [Candidatus Limnocylindrales bacterium]